MSDKFFRKASFKEKMVILEQLNIIQKSKLKKVLAVAAISLGLILLLVILSLDKDEWYLENVRYFFILADLSVFYIYVRAYYKTEKFIKRVKTDKFRIALAKVVSPSTENTVSPCIQFELEDNPKIVLSSFVEPASEPGFKEGKEAYLVKADDCDPIYGEEFEAVLKPEIY